MENDKRVIQDRRKKPTPFLSWYTFFGRRKGFRRKSDQKRGGYVDRYSSKLFLLLIVILVLNALDVFLAITILNQKGWALSPMLHSIMQLHRDRLWIWKFGIVSVALVLLCLHSKFKPARAMLAAVSSIYFLVILYQLYLLVL